MVTLDRIRLTGLLRKKPWQRGFFYCGLSLRTRHGLVWQPFGGLSGTARRGHPTVALRLVGVAPPRRGQDTSCGEGVRPRPAEPAPSPARGTWQFHEISLEW